MGLKEYKRKRQPLLTEKHRKIDFDLQRNTKICLKKNGEDYVFNDESPMYNFVLWTKLKKNDIVWGSQEDKVSIAKTVKKSAYVNIGGGGGRGGGQCQLVDIIRVVLPVLRGGP